MPDLNEFLSNNKEKVYPAEIERIEGIKPCAQCEKDSNEYFWDAATLTMSWKCPSGHDNSFRIN